MKTYMIGALVLLLVGCSSVNVVYTKNGITETFQVDTQGSHTIVLSSNEVTITSK